MDIDLIRASIHRVAREVRVPPEIRRGSPNEISGELEALRPQQKSSHIENYMVDVAEARGELEEHRVILLDALHELRRQGRELPWQNYLQNVRKPTQHQVAEAKRRAAPDLVASIETAEHLLGQIRNQLDRLDKEHDSMSRIYTILVGG
jgi:hypothetical protein